MNFKINNIGDWQQVVDEIYPHLKYKILVLKGNLGAGKTSFSQFLLKKMGSTDTVTSPTYAIVNEYNTPKGKVFHFDLYRLNTIEEVYDIGMDEYLENSELCIIEWPEIYENELSYYGYHEMTIEIDGDSRTIHFQ
ncbi:tRNA (adenosine(37)-N6)-threonylcarbamoyltransferase complex ATPase subunit type 1 TsaE [Amniculibacterium aquaticum]|uniref:tRNA (adenosine(37)-N6)-threonylcarbamoyltransferase complex ATPase subunit type 1 TsaE n=1 Tax=Amniculibacterium aquaticum TaxID=2479858 RepID=UPI000F58F4F5|nr:tRNA (adenosine(37)-N6)-threonylcarbamoyltransferase complex ATPase subunit type 1 TsaE [Amniculibacterium aquaticum]